MRLAEERQAAILRAIDLRGAVSATDIAERLGVSTVTIRRDITSLAERGLVRRVHGGAVSIRSTQSPATGAQRSRPRATIGLMLPSATYYYSSVIRGAEALAAARGVRLVLAITHYFPDEDRRQLSRLLNLGVDGLLVSTSGAPDLDADLASWLEQVNVPLLLIERRVDLPQASHIGHVRTDHAVGARLALRHLTSLGHSSVAVAARENSPTTRWLLEGHAEAVAKGLITDSPDPVLLPLSAESPAQRDATLEELLDQCVKHGTAGVLVHTDEDAIALAQAARGRGLTVPDDLSIVAYDDEIAALSDVPLTAVAPPKTEVGRLAVETLLQQLSSATTQPVRHISIVPDLVVRGSTAPPRA